MTSNYDVRYQFFKIDDNIPQDIKTGLISCGIIFILMV